MNFILTNHAKKRIEERNIDDPNKINVVVAKNAAKKLIVAQCKLNKFKTGNEYVYFRTNEKDLSERVAYVCVILGVAKYLVITAFHLKYEINKS